ncbi:unnamed protein product [Durusdinium trenchii]|uniref:Guanylate cyclase domain-containing protein n=1 Tax=Durusdinium trenchii TaxID=1381693 RepID=A0ABP0K0F1_9DINO
MRATLHRLNKLASRSHSEQDREVSYAMRLLRRGSSSLPAAEEEDAPSMPDEQFELCAQKSWDQNIAEGAGTLMTLNLCWALLRLFELLRDLIWVDSAQQDSCNGEVFLAWRLIEFGFLLGLVWPLFRTIKQPRAALYFPILALYFLYVVLIGLWPLSFSCQELEELKDCKQREYILKRFERLDCGLQGESLVQVMMAWLMLMPRVMPSLKLMHFTWVWIAAYFCSAMAKEESSKSQGTPSESSEEPRTFADLLLILLLLCSVNLFAFVRKYYLEKGQRTKFIYDWRQRQATQQIFQLLEFMVPVHVIVPMLRKPGEVIADPVKCASILFVMFVDFDQTARKKEPAELLDYLNSYFTQFDEICAKHEVTKIETVGEEYVCAVGVVPKDWEVDKALGHQVILHRLIKAASEMLEVQRDAEEDVKFKMGIHTGPVVAGVIGQKLPRFRLFGDTINTAARIMQKGLPGELQFGKATKDCLPPGVRSRFRDNIEMKGKGKVPTWLLGSEPTEPQAKPPKPPKARKRVSFAEEMRDSVSSRGSRPSITEVLTSTALPSAPEENEAWNMVQQLSERSKNLRREARERPTRGSRGSQGGSAGIELSAMSPRRSSLKRSSTDSRRSWNEEAGLRRSSRLSEVWSETQTFEDVLEKITAEDGEDSAIISVDSALAQLKRLFSPGREGFTQEMEEKFHQWFHDNTTCKKMDARLDRQVLFISVLTTVDMAYTVFYTKVFEVDAVQSGKLRLPVFLCSRMAILFIILAWRVAYASKHAMLLDYKKASHGLLVSYCTIAMMMFSSYNALTELGTKYQPERSIHSLLIMPMFQLIITQNPFLFRISVVFVVLASVLMSMQSFALAFGNLFMTHQTRVVFVGVSVVQCYVAHTAEISFRQRWRAQNAVSFTRERTQSILNTLMPVMVVEQLRDNPSGYPSHNYRKATIAQSDLCGFTKLASTREPQEVVQFIGELFGLFDELTDKYEVYKVETVGDAYIAGQAEAPLTYKNSPMSVVRFGLEMVQRTHRWSRGRGEQVSCRVGVHSGECIGGIVGTEMQRYHLFGKLMTEVEVLESTAPEGRVQVSQACKDAVDKQISLEGISEDLAALNFEERPEDFLTTSKGEEHSYEEVGGRTFVVRSYVY